MVVAKVTLNGTTLMDTTDATADASKILNAYTAYIGDGICFGTCQRQSEHHDKQHL